MSGNDPFDTDLGNLINAGAYFAGLVSVTPDPEALDLLSSELQRDPEAFDKFQEGASYGRALQAKGRQAYQQETASHHERE